MDIARRITELREEHDWKKTELARRLGISHSQVSTMANLISKPAIDALRIPLFQNMCSSRAAGKQRRKSVFEQKQLEKTDIYPLLP